jgi:hypothetical protein
MRSATIYVRSKDILLHASSRTTDGVWILSEPVTRVDHDCPDAPLGDAVRAALQASRSGVRHPKVWTGLLDPRLKVANVKGWATFVRGSRCVRVEEEAGSITLIPTQNLGAKEGFKDEPGATTVVSQAPPDALGQAVRVALARAT